jgi:hypothetical protein
LVTHVRQAVVVAEVECGGCKENPTGVKVVRMLSLTAYVVLFAEVGVAAVVEVAAEVVVVVVVVAVADDDSPVKSQAVVSDDFWQYRLAI